MRIDWFRNPRVGAGVAILAALVVGWLAAAGGRPGWEAVLLALVAAALAAWTWLAMQGIGWFWQAPRREEVQRTLDLQASQHAFNHGAWRHLDRDAGVLRALLAERVLREIEGRLETHESAVARFDAIGDTLPGWSYEAAQWYATASQAHPGLPSATPVPTATALTEARDLLPPDRVLAGDDLKHALHFLVARKRLAADRAAIERERLAMLRKLAVELPLPGGGEAAERR